MTRIFKTCLFVSTVSALALAVFPAAAQIAPLTGTNLGIPEKGDFLTYITSIVLAFLALIGIVAVIFIIIAGVRYMSSQGDPQESEKAKKAIIYAVIGLIVVGLAAVVVNFILALIR